MKECECVNDSDNEGVMKAIFGETANDYEKRSILNEPAADVNANGHDTDDEYGKSCYTSTNGVTTTVFITSTTKTVTTTSSEAPTFTTTQTIAYRPTNDITNDSSRASTISKFTFIALALVAMLFI